MFISSMVLQWIMTFSSCQQNDQKCMNPQFHWFRCCTHVWPSMEDVNLSFFCADKRQVYPRRHCNFYWSNNLREEHKTLQNSVKSTFSISIQIKCNWLPGNTQPSPYIYMSLRGGRSPKVSLGGLDTLWFVHELCQICLGLAWDWFRFSLGFV